MKDDPPLKRKRTSCYLSTPKKTKATKKVRFDTDNNIIIYTYSSEEYDRGASPVLYKLNPSIPLKPKLSLDIPTLPPSSPCDSEDDGSSNSSSPSTPAADRLPPFSPKKQRPKLSVDTSICTGPLFFTSLSTNHVRHTVRSNWEDDDDTNSYLVPMSASVLSLT
ncbi:hypothetical protein EC973_005605 [Apophysomyces ossiformis]|uniref:Uncharacterized protein n=1 Tax=Apophysomyces ossiformis TaxID=679940 RepID=A0A8H7BRZ2_9FUNG|nr:hypothetical protein EC973_005605 [Apophysomyces ossiformis]